MLIDTHPHIVSDDDEKYPKRPLGGVRSTWSQERPATWEELSDAMTAADVTRAVVVQSSTTYGHDNSYLADCVESAGGRIAGVCSIGLLDDDVFWQIRHWIDQRGMAGVRLFTFGTTVGQASWFQEEKANPVWTYLADNGIPVTISLSNEALPQLQPILREFTGLRILLDHAGNSKYDTGPPYTGARRLYDLATFPGVYVKLTSRNLREGAASEGGTQEMLTDLIRHFGSDRLVWGSNWPAYQGSLAELAASLRTAVEDLPSEDADNICAATALRLFPQLADRSSRV